MQIFIKCYNSKILTLNVDLDMKIGKIKLLIFDKLGIPPCKQKLFFSTKTLEDLRLVSDYDIHKESTLFLEKDFSFKCSDYLYIIYDGNKKLELNKLCIHTCNTLYLKNKIEKILGIDKKYQLLTVGGKIMEDSESLISNNIINGKEIKFNVILDVNEFINLKNKKNLSNYFYKHLFNNINL